MARPAKEVNLKPGDLEELESWLRHPTMRQSHVERARIIVLSSEGKCAAEIAQQFGVSTVTVFKWRARYRAKGLAGLTDLPRPGQPRKLTPATVKKILDLTTKRIPNEATHWSLRLMMKYAGVTQWQVQQVWAASELRPHRLRTFKISNDPQFAEKVVDVVGLYLQPPDTTRWCCRSTRRHRFKRWIVPSPFYSFGQGKSSVGRTTTSAMERPVFMPPSTSPAARS